MVLEKKPFVRYKFDEEKALEKDITFTIRLNEEEQKLLSRVKSLLDIPQNSTTMKILAFEIGTNVLFNNFSEKLLKYLSSNRRTRKSDYTAKN